jgi:hypothetical protein
MGLGMGSFSQSVGGLYPGTTYHVRAFATNSSGTSYGAVVNVTTSTPALTITPSHVLTEGNLHVSYLTASIFSCIAFFDGNPNVSDYQLNNAPAGVTIEKVTYINPLTVTVYLAYDWTNFDTDVTNFSLTIKSAGLGYLGSNVTSNNLTITAFTPPSVTTSAINTYDECGAEMGGVVTDEGEDMVTDRGFVYSDIEATPILGRDSEVHLGAGIGSFSQSVGGLYPGTTYHVRAFATNSSGTSYGAVVNVTTSMPALTITPSHVLTEGNLHVSYLTASIFSGIAFFDGNPNVSDYQLNNAPTGVTIEKVTFINPSAVKVYLAYDWTDFDTDVTNFSLTIKSAGLGYLGSNVTSNNLTITAGIDVDTVAPTVSGITPTGATSVPTGGNIAVTFSEAIDNATAGTISLSSDGSTFTALPAGNWSAGNTVYTVLYSGLLYNTLYTMKIENFQDYSSNTMVTDTSHSFTTIPNNDASLSDLTLSHGAALSPAFAGGTTSYTASVANNVTSLTVTPTVHDANATVKVNGTPVTSGTPSGNIALSVGPNTINVVVTAQDGSTTGTYTIIVTRAGSTNASLSGLTLSQGTLTPAFAGGTPSYTASVANSVDSLTVTPTVHDTNATVKVNGTLVPSGTPSGDIALSVGANTINVVVTAQDGLTALTYTVNVSRADIYIPPSPSYSAGASGGTSLPVTANSGTGNASVNIDAQIGALLAGGRNETIKMPSVPGVTSYSLGIPVATLTTLGGGSLTFDTDTGGITLPADMLAGVAGAAGKVAQITIGRGDTTKLPAEAQSEIGSHPLIQLSLTLDDVQTDWNNPNAPVTISIPYKPTAEELKNPGSIVVWYIDGSGKLACVPNGHYDAATGAVTFEITHFSLYAVGYNPASFSDVVAGVWYYDAVTFAAARGITTGTGGGHFSPGAALTRGQMLVMLLRAYGIAPDENPAVNFADAGNTYYTGYLAAAKRLGIANGVGNNLFAPEQQITRQEMFTLLYNALKAISQLPHGNSGKMLSSFTDSAKIAEWAKDAITLLVATGTITGSGDKLDPTAITTRAELAQVLYSLLEK